MMAKQRERSGLSGVAFINVRRHGFDRLDRQFAAIGAKGFKKILRQALRTSAKRLKKEVIRRVPIDEGDYLDDVMRAPIRSESNRRNFLRVGISRREFSELSRIKSESLERGHTKRKLRGTPRAQPHWRPAVDENIRSEERKTQEQLWRLFKQELAKIA